MTDSDARPSRETLHCLDLFCGLGGFSAAFQDSTEWDVTTVDINDRFDPDICADVLNLRPGDLPDVDVILASPPCKTFSKAAAWADHFDADGSPNTDEAKEAVALVFHTIGLIRALDPDYWFLENPQGHMRKFLGQPTGEVTYCQYGEVYQKPTDLWGDHPPMTYRTCSRGEDCHRRSRKSTEEGDGNHPADAMPRDPAERAKVPYELSEAIFEAVEGRSEQCELPLITDGGTARPVDEVEINIETELWSLITEELQQELWDPLASIATGKGDVNQRTSCVHLDPDCRGIDEPQRQVAAATRWDDTDICSYCNGTWDNNVPDSGPVPSDFEGAIADD